VKLTRLLVGCALVFIGCSSSDTTAPTIGVSGSMSFAFTGGGGGTFNATGSMPVNVATTFGTAPWAVAASNASSQTLIVEAAIPRGTNSWDFATIHVAGLTTGTRTIGCTGQTCNDFAVFIETNTAESNYQFFCTLTSGSITVASISATHATGSFSGSGSCTGSTPGTPTAFAVTNGSFDVGIYNGAIP
jgi:hypothetical protein